MVVLGVGLGVYYLNKEGRPFPGPDGAAAATGSRTFAFAGLIVLGAAAASAYGFEMSAVCGSVLSPFVPWGATGAAFCWASASSSGGNHERITQGDPRHAQT